MYTSCTSEKQINDDFLEKVSINVDIYLVPNSKYIVHVKQ